jgi:hypothetical protein
MEFLKLFLRGVALLPAVIQGIETLYGAKTGVQKRDAAIAIVGAAINVADAAEAKTIVDPAKFTAALGVIVDGVVACLNASIWHSSAV